MNNLEKQISESLFHLTEDRQPSDHVMNNILNSLEKRSKRKKMACIYFRRISSGVAVALLIVGLMLSSAFIFPSIAEAVESIPIIGSIFNFMGDNGLKNAQNQGVISTINQKAENKDISITINDVLYDDARIVIGFKEKCNGEFKNLLGESNNILINNKLAPNCGMGISYKKVGEGIYVGLLDIKLPDYSETDQLNNDPRFFSGKLPDNFTLGLHLNEIEGVKGTWNFDIPVSKEKSQASTKKFTPGITKTYNNVTVSLDKVIFAPSCVGLTFSMNPFGGAEISYYRVFDDQGNELEAISDSPNEPLYLPVKEVPKSLKIVPYTSSTIYIRKAISKFPMTISQGKLGVVTVKKIEFLKDKTLIYYDFKAKSASATPNEVRIESQQPETEGGNYILEGFPNGPTEKLKKPVKVTGNSYVQEYKAIDSTKDLYINTISNVDPKPIPVFEMTVPLQTPIK